MKIRQGLKIQCSGRCRGSLVVAWLSVVTRWTTSDGISPQIRQWEDWVVLQGLQSQTRQPSASLVRESVVGTCHWGAPWALGRRRGSSLLRTTPGRLATRARGKSCPEDARVGVTLARPHAAFPRTPGRCGGRLDRRRKLDMDDLENHHTTIHTYLHFATA